MNAFLHRGVNRGHVKTSWLDTKHSFSFGSWYDPKYMGIASLRVINEDRIAAQQGFGQHPHDNMEILTCVLSGTISHQDSMGNQTHIRAGEWQLMSAGDGIRHSEMNLGDSPVHMLQIWIQPNILDAAPTYQQIQCDPQTQANQWHLIAGPDADAAMHIRQNATVSTAFLEAGQTLDLVSSKDVYYVHVISGEVHIAEYSLVSGDALAFQDAVKIRADQDSQLICFHLGAQQ